MILDNRAEGMRDPVVRLVFSSDLRGIQHVSTVLASVIRRTASRVEARIYTRGFRMADFETDHLAVTFRHCEETVTGSYPQHVSPAVFDRLRIIRDETEWDRVLVMDHDMLVLADLQEYFREPFGENLLLGRHFGPGNTLELQMRQRGGLPEVWQPAGPTPYFHMGPMMNLAAMRVEGTWDKLLAAHAGIGRDEQISLTAACAWRAGPAHPKWNLVPQWDKLAESEKWSREAPGEKHMTRPAGVVWQRGLPEGLIHWTGGAKPWHSNSKVWRADLWKSELCSWELLRAGRWKKYRARIIGASHSQGALALLTRGWKVELQDSAEAGGLLDTMPGYPDLSGVPDNRRPLPHPPDLVRFGTFSDPLAWVEQTPRPPEAIAVEGPVAAEVLAGLRTIGYKEECRVERKKWPAGGPHPGVLEYSDPGEALAVDASDDVYLILPGFIADRVAAEASATGRGVQQRGPDETTAASGRHAAPTWLAQTPKDARVLWLNPPPDEDLPDAAARLRGIDFVASDAGLWKSLQQMDWKSAPPRLLYCPLDPVSGWFDTMRMPGGPYDWVVVDAHPGARNARAEFHPMAGSYVRNGGTLVFTPRAMSGQASPGSSLMEKGWKSRRSGDGTELYSPPRPGRANRRISTRLAEAIWRDFVGNAFVVSLPERQDRRDALAANWTELGIRYQIVPGVRLGAEDVRWAEMKGMEAYGNPANLRGDYIPRAVGCKRAITNALREFLATGKAHGLICEDDCRWRAGVGGHIRRALLDLPRDWDMLYFSASRRKPHLPETSRLMRLTGARMSTAILWTRHAAERAATALEISDKECDVTLEGLHAEMKAYAVHPMPAYQGFSKSSITGSVAAPMNL